jgi:hypothetical protein
MVRVHVGRLDAHPNENAHFRRISDNNKLESKARD